MNKYPCIVYIFIVRLDGDVEVSRKIDLPFVPCPGISIVFNHEECDYVEIRRVEYLAEHGCFWVNAKTNTWEDCACKQEDCSLCYLNPISRNPDDGPTTIEWLKRLGWEVVR